MNNHKLFYFNPFLPARLIQLKGFGEAEKGYDKEITNAIHTGDNQRSEEEGEWFAPEEAEERSRVAMEALKKQIEKDKNTALVPGVITLDGEEFEVLGTRPNPTADIIPATTQDGSYILSRDRSGRLIEGLSVASAKTARNLPVLSRGLRNIRGNKAVDKKIASEELEKAKPNLTTADEVLSLTVSERSIGEQKEYEAMSKTMAERFKSTPDKLKNVTLVSGYSTVYKTDVLGLLIDGEFIPVSDEHGQGILPGEKTIRWGEVMDYVFEKRNVEWTYKPAEEAPEWKAKGYDRNKDMEFFPFEVYRNFELFPRYARIEEEKKDSKGNPILLEDGTHETKVTVGEFLGLWEDGVFIPTQDADGEYILPRNEKNEKIHITWGEAKEMSGKNWKRRKEGGGNLAWETGENGRSRLRKKKALTESGEGNEKEKRGPYVPALVNGVYVLGVMKGDSFEAFKNEQGEMIPAFDQNNNFRDFTEEEAKNFSAQSKEARRRAQARAKGVVPGNIPPVPVGVDGKPLRRVAETPEEREARIQATRERLGYNLPEGYTFPAKEYFVKPEKGIKIYNQEELEEIKKAVYDSDEAAEKAAEVGLQNDLTEVYGPFRSNHMQFESGLAKQWAEDLVTLFSELLPEVAPPANEPEKETLFNGVVRLIQRKIGTGISTDGPNAMAGKIDYNNPSPEKIYLLYLALNSLARVSVSSEVFDYDTNFNIQWPEVAQKAMREERKNTTDVVAKNYGVEAIINGYVDFLPREGGLQLTADGIGNVQRRYLAENGIHYAETSPEATLGALEWSKIVEAREAEYRASKPEDRPALLEKYKQVNMEFEEVHRMQAEYAKRMEEASLSPEEEARIKQQIVDRLNETMVLEARDIHGNPIEGHPKVVLTVERYFDKKLTVSSYLGSMNNEQLEDLYKRSAEDGKVQEMITLEGKTVNMTYKEAIKKELEARGYTFVENSDYEKQKERIFRKLTPEYLMGITSSEALVQMYRHEKDPTKQALIAAELGQRELPLPPVEPIHPEYAPDTMFMTDLESEDYSRRADQIAYLKMIRERSQQKYEPYRNEGVEKAVGKKETASDAIDEEGQATFANRVGDDFYKRGEFFQAAEAHKVATELAPDVWQYHEAYAKDLFRLQRYTEAKTVFEKVLNILKDSQKEGVENGPRIRSYINEIETIMLEGDSENEPEENATGVAEEGEKTDSETQEPVEEKAPRGVPVI